METIGYDPFTAEVSLTPSESYLLSLKNFTMEYQNKIKDLHDSINANLNSNWSLESDPFAIDCQPYDQLSTLRMLTDTDNEVFEKIMKVFVALCFEAEDLERIAKNKFYPMLLAYEQRPAPKVPLGNSITRVLSNEADSAIEVAKFIPSLQDLYFYIKRVSNVGKNLVGQLGCIYNEKSGKFSSTFKHVSMREIWNALKRLIVIMITLDAIIGKSEKLKRDMAIFKKVSKTVTTAPATFSFTEAEIKPFLMTMQLLEGSILSGTIFSSFCSQPFHIMSVAPVINNSGLMKAFQKEIEESTKDIFVRIDDADKKDLYNTLFSTNATPCSLAFAQPFEFRLISTCGLICMYPQVFNHPYTDRDVAKSLFESCRKVPVVLLSAGSGTTGAAVGFFPTAFLMHQAPAIFKIVAVEGKWREGDLYNDATTALLGMDPCIPNRILVAALKANVWAVSMESSISNAALSAQQALKEQRLIEADRLGKTADADEDLEFMGPKKDVINQNDIQGSLSVTAAMQQSQVVSSQEMRLLDMTITYRQKLILVGLDLAATLQRLISTYVTLYVVLGATFPSSHMRLVLFAVATLKKIAAVFFSRAEQISCMIGPSLEGLKVDLTGRMQSIAQRSGLSSGRHLSSAQLDQLAAVKIFTKLMSGPITTNELRAASVALDLLKQKSIMLPKDVNHFENELLQMYSFASLNRSLHIATDCSFLYWWTDIMPLFFKIYCEQPSVAPTFNLFCVALHDPLRFVHNYDDVAKNYVERVQNALKDALLQPLGRMIETRLRLDVQNTVNMWLSKTSKGDVVSSQGAGTLTGAPSATANTPEQLARTLVEDRIITTLCNLPPLRLFGEVFSLKSRIELYLSTTFYNLTTIHLSDWRTYSEMSSLALEKYGLIIDDLHLPTQTLEQGLDMLEVARNLPAFVSRYVYNMNMQCFVEIPQENKQINTMTVRHFANSIRTHGTGIMNTTVNLAYHLLTKDLSLFIQFLQDEHIKSFLAKDFRYWKKNRDQLDKMYPWSMAEDLIKAIRRLGSANDNTNFVDKFRRLVTELGNTLGFIRMIRSGSQRYCSEAVKFVPDLNEISSFKELVTQEKLSNSSSECAESLDLTLDNLVHNFGEGTDFFQLILVAFRDKLKDDGVNTMYLRGFPFIVPATTIAFVEALITMKENLLKKRRGAAFSDDGLAMGITFILSLLNQTNAFKSLHWFDSVNVHAQKQKKIAEEKIAKLSRRGNTQDAQTLQLTIKKWERYQEEFTLLKYAFDGSRVLFKEN